MVSTVQLLLEKGANILARDENGMYGISDCPRALCYLEKNCYDFLCN